MKRHLLFLFITPLFMANIYAQQNDGEKSLVNSDLPYYQIPAYPDNYSTVNVIARMIDGLGFRYYWATEGLRPEDLSFKPSEKARTTAETINHIYGLSHVILNASLKQDNARRNDEPEYSFEEKRRKTLENIKQASDIFRSSKDSEMDSFKAIFKGKDSTTEYPFWNIINGPIADAIWHCGQVVSFRRSSGNPMNPKVSVFNGKLRE